MTLDEVIKHQGFTDDLSNIGFTKGYNKAIDDCNKIIENAFDDNIINSIAYACIIMNFEQLKRCINIKEVRKNDGTRISSIE